MYIKRAHRHGKMSVTGSWQAVLSLLDRPTLRTTRGCVLRQELNEKDILIIYATGVGKKTVKKANRESPTGIEPMTYQIPDARSELRRESWCYLKRVLYSAKMLRST